MSAKRRQAFDFFVRQGWTAAQSAGLVANLEAESALRPDAIGDGGQAYGIAQWHPPRQRDFAAIMGRDIRGSSYEDQLAFVHAELQRGEARAGDALRDCQTAGEAGACVSKLYERPADREGEAAKRAQRAEIIFAEYAGTAPEQPTGGAAPPDVPAPQPTKPEAPMGPLMFLPAILQLIPQLAPLFGKGGDKVQAMIPAATAIINAFTQAVPGAVNTQDAIERATADPAIAAQAKAAVLQAPAVAMLLEVGGGIPAARRHDAAARDSSVPWWRALLSPAFVISLILLSLVWFVAWNMLMGKVELWRPEDRSQVLMLVVAITSGVMGYFLGSSLGSLKKDEIIANRQ